MTGAFAVALLASSFAALAEDSAPLLPRPQAVILVSLDTLRADYLNLYGFDTYETSPVLDAFAEESVVFEAAMASEPWTLSSHMSLFTGLTAQHHGVGENVALAANVPTLAESLRAQGYATQGYADGGYLRERWGFGRGFDLYNARRRRGFGRLLLEATNGLTEVEGQPFFLFLQTYDVHNIGRGPHYKAAPPHRGVFSRPFMTKSAQKIAKGGYFAPTPNERETLYIRATYAEGVREADETVGKLFGLLKSLKVWDRALVIIWSDHGEGLYDHGLWSHNQVFEHTARTVLMMKIPGVDGGRRIRTPVSAVDLLPTILELVGAPPGKGLDGSSLVDVIRGGQGRGEAFVTHTAKGNGLYSLRTETHRYIWDEKADRSYLFDLISDPQETNNLSPSSGDLEASLRDRLFSWMKEQGAAKPSLEQSPAIAPLDEETQRELRALGYLE